MHTVCWYTVCFDVPCTRQNVIIIIIIYAYRYTHWGIESCVVLLQQLIVSICPYYVVGEPPEARSYRLTVCVALCVMTMYCNITVHYTHICTCITKTVQLTTLTLCSILLVRSSAHCNPSQICIAYIFAYMQYIISCETAHTLRTMHVMMIPGYPRAKQRCFWLMQP